MGHSNIEKWAASADAKELHTSKVAGAVASHHSRTLKKQTDDKLNALVRERDVPELLKGILSGELTAEQRQVVRDIVPASIPTENITPMIAWTYACIDKGIRSGDTAAFEKVLRLAGVSAELAIKMDVKQEFNATVDFSTMTDDELRRYADMQIIEADYEEMDTDV